MTGKFTRQTMMLFSLLMLLCFTASGSFAQTKDFVSVDAARYSLVVAPDSIAAGFTAGVTSQTFLADDADLNTPGVQLPTSLGGISVSVNNRLAGLFFVSPNQVNYAVPAQTETSGPATVVVTDAAGNVLAQGTLNVAQTMLSLFTSNSSGTGAPAALVTADGVNYSVVGKPDGTSNLVSAGQYLVLFGTGIRGSQSDIRAFIGGVEAPVAYAGLQGGFLALYQVNVQIPESLAGQGPVELSLVDGTTVSNTVTIDLGGNPAAVPGAPIVTALSANSAVAGQIVTLTGSNFPVSVDQATVRLGSSYGRVVSSNATQLSFIVPYGAASGRIAVSNAAGERLSNHTLSITTSISGTILAPDGAPLSNLVVSVASANVSTTTDNNGRFLLAGVPAGINRVEIDASGSQYASESLSIVATSDRDNELSAPVTLLQDFGADLILGNEPGEAPATDPATAKTIEHDGLRLTIPGKVTFPNGATQGRLRLGRVNRDHRLPVSLPAGVYPSVIAFIGPGGTTFGENGKDLASLSFPNVDQLPAGTKLDLYAFDRQVTPSAFVKRGEAVVNQAGDKIVADSLIDIATIWFVGLPVDSAFVTKVTGRVIDSGDKPVSGARVFTRGRGAITDVRGNFVITSARAKNGDELHVEVHFFTPTGVPLKASKTVKAVVPGETAVGDIKLPAEPALVILIRPGEAKIKAGESARFKVVLSKPLTEDASINIEKLEGVDCVFSAASLKIEAGKTEAEFTASSQTPGRAVIGATLASASSGITTEQARGARAHLFVLPPAPVLSSITPNSGAPGASFMIAGSGFSSEPRHNQIIFSQGERWMALDSSKVSVVSTPNGVTGLKGVVPGIKPGEYDVFVMVFREGALGVPSNKVKFTVLGAPAPQLTAIDPREGKPGALFTLTGSGFSPEAKLNGVFFRIGERVFPVDPATLQVILGTATNTESRPPVTGLKGQAPRMPAGEAEVYVVVFRENTASAASNKLPFKVIGEAAPKLDSIDPAEAQPGASFVLKGSGFAPERTLVAFAQGERKFFLDPKTTSVATDAIKCVLPGLPAGQYDVFVVVNNDNITGTLSNKLPFKVLAPAAPVLKSLSPTEGLPGSTFTITGENFGEHNSVVFTQGDRMVTVDPALVKTSSSGVTVTAPRLPAGEYMVFVRALRGSAVSELSNGLAFKVLAPPAPAAPKLEAITPVEAAPGETFTITGSGFASEAAHHGVFFKFGERVVLADPKMLQLTPNGLSGKVPAVLAGVYEVFVVVFENDARSEASNSLAFKVLSPTPATPELSAVRPADGAAPGQAFAISGKNFGRINQVFFKQGDRVALADPTKLVLTAENTVLTGVVPELAAGEVEVWVKAGFDNLLSLESNHLRFIVLAKTN
jgi:uncharacterized protein (TIGR03437 family)